MKVGYTSRETIVQLRDSATQLLPCASNNQLCLAVRFPSLPTGDENWDDDHVMPEYDWFPRLVTNAIPEIEGKLSNREGWGFGRPVRGSTAQFHPFPHENFEQDGCLLPAISWYSEST